MLFWTVLGVSGAAATAHKSRHHEHLFFLLMPLLGIPAGLVLIVGGWRMMRCRGFSWPVAASLWAMFPWSPGWFIGLPCGIWALSVLRRPESQIAFGVAARRRNPLASAANGLIIVGILAGTFWTVLGICLLATAPTSVSEYRMEYDSGGRLVRNYYANVPNNERFLILLMPLLALPSATVLVVGGARMLQSRSYQFAVLTAMWAMVPWSPFWPFGLAFGIWAFATLRRRDVQIAFGQPFRSGGGAFEPPVAAVSPPRRLAGPVRRKLHAVFDSMYSLVVGSRLKHESQATGAASPSAAALHYSEFYDRSESRLDSENRGWAWLKWAALAFGLLLALAIAGSITVTVLRARAEREQAERAAMLAQNSQPQGVLRQNHDDLVRVMRLGRYGLDKPVGDVFRSTEDDYLDLEARFTKRERGDDGHLKVIILPFKDEADKLYERFLAKLKLVLDANMYKAAEDYFRPRQFFPFGQQKVKLEMWRHGGWYHGNVITGVDGPGVPGKQEFDGPQLPKAYERFWAD
jgi:hypothetical protein